MVGRGGAKNKGLTSGPHGGLDKGRLGARQKPSLIIPRKKHQNVQRARALAKARHTP